MSMIRELIYRNSFFLHHWVIKRNAWNVYKLLVDEKFDYQDVGDIERYQSTLFAVMTTYIKRYPKHPYYNLIEHGFHRKSIITTKNDIRNNKNYHLNIMGDLKIATSGSTGNPLTMYADPFALEVRMASTLKNLTSTGYRFGDRTVRLWHSTIGMSSVNALKEKLDAYLSNRVFLPIFKIDDDVILNYLKFLYNYKPVLIDGYAEAFNLFARILIKYKDKSFIRKFLKNFRVKVIVTSAQTLTQEVREFWRDNFNANVYDKYGSREFSGIAFQCDRGSYHVNSENYIVDLKKIDDNYSEIYVTDLLNRATPLINYEIGDIVSNHSYYNTCQCPCGRQNQIIGKPEGRKQAILYGLENTYLVGTFFAHYMKDFEYYIKSFQFIQNSKYEIEFYYVPNIYKDLSKIIHNICKYISARLGGIQINQKCVKEIEMVRTGKNSHSICNLDEFQKELKL